MSNITFLITSIESEDVLDIGMRKLSKKQTKNIKDRYKVTSAPF
jgi:hypothetical protein